MTAGRTPLQHKKDNTMFDDELIVIAVYSRADALEDGVLVDVSDTAKEAGIKHPTAVTRAVWDRYIALSASAVLAGNDERGRLWDVCWMFRCAAVCAPDATEVRFHLYVTTDAVEPTLVTLKAVCSPGDDESPVITIMLPEED